jgi:hypothetical protein
MTSEHIDQLRPLALDHRLLRTLIALWDFDESCREEWPFLAVRALTVGQMLRSRARAG